ncbi:MAG: TIGR02466 family protein [Pseudomonadota bacterium]
MTSRDLFPTRIQQLALPDAALISDLEASCWMVEDGDQAGHAWCEEQGYPGYTSYASLEDLPTRAPAFADLVSILETQAAIYAGHLDWDLSAGRLELAGFWINILGEGMGHSGHIHPGSVISGTAYVAMPEGAGSLRLEDPRLPMMMSAPPLMDSAETSRFVYLTPNAGDVLMWESWLRHEVMPSRSEDPRISISFNFAYLPSP